MLVSKCLLSMSDQSPDVPRRAAVLPASLPVLLCVLLDPGAAASPCCGAALLVLLVTGKSTSFRGNFVF